MEGVKQSAGFGWLVIALFAAVPALAGEYHYGASLECMQCHTMHYSQKHDYNGDAGSGSPSGPPSTTFPQATLDTGGPFVNLLRDEDSALCLSCHDDWGFAPDVLGAHSGSYQRQAGGLTDSYFYPATAGNYAETNGHTLGRTGPGQSGNTPHPPPIGRNCDNCHVEHEGPGPGLTLEPLLLPLECTSCHNPHGNEGYRNLSVILPKDGTDYTLSYAKGSNNTNQDVFIRGWSLEDIAGNYSVDNVDFNEPNPTGSAMADLCNVCHGNFHGAAGDPHMGGSGGTEWLRHPTADANIGGVGDSTHSDETIWAGMTNRVKVMSPTGVWSGPLTDLTPSCMTCHKSHGNQNPFGLIYMDDDAGGITEEGTASGEFQDLCRQCHVQ